MEPGRGCAVRVGEHGLLVRGVDLKALPGCRSAWARSCSLPLYPALTEEEAIQYSAAFVQLYREDAHYLERTAPWLERKGLEWIKAQMLDDPDAVTTLAARFYYSQQFMQDDPWAKRAAGERRDLHKHLGTIRAPAMENV